jgi:hypothetical protein
MWGRMVWHKLTDVSEEHMLPSPGLKNNSRSASSSTLKMEATLSSKTSVNIHHIAMRHIPEVVFVSTALSASNLV